MPTLASPIARTFSPTVGTDTADAVAGSTGPIAPGGFDALVNQLVQTAAAPATTGQNPAADAVTNALVPGPGAAAQPGKFPPLAAPTAVATAAEPSTMDSSAAKAAQPATPRSTTTTGKKSDQPDDAEKETPPPSTDPSIALLTTVPPAATPIAPPPASLPVGTDPTVSVSPADASATSVSPAAEASNQIADDGRQAATPTRIADQRSLAAQAGLSDHGEQDAIEHAAPATGGMRTSVGKKPSASTAPDHGLAAGLPQAAPAAMPAPAPSAPANAPPPGRALVEATSRQTQTAITSPAGPAKAAAADPVSPVALSLSEQSPPLPVIVPPASTSTGPTNTASVAEARPPPAAPPTPAAQVAQAIVEPVKVVLTRQDNDPAVPHVTTIQITPAELGRVEVRIERPADGSAKIQLVAERADTLSRLVQDQSQLNQALDAAGLPQHSRTIEFSLAPATGGDAFASQSSGGNASGGNSSGGFSQGRGGRYSGQDLTFSDDPAGLSAATSRALRSGIDITA